ncbi:MAG TPA: DegV family protein [Dehalococcoidia bacterium]|nr:DegV family protein [Dehalococcoidia bacterium]
MVKIVTDTGSDISPELAQQLDITLVPLYVRFGEKVYRDGIDIDPDELYQRLETDPIHPTTSAPSPGDFTETYKKLARESDSIVSIHLTSKLSATYDAALQGREALTETKCQVEIVDSRSITAGLALITIAAATAAKAGESLSRVLAQAHNAIRQIRMVGLLDTLKYVAKGGRIGKAASLLGTALNVKPMLTLRDGEVHPAGLARTRDRGIARLCDFVKAAVHVQDLALACSTRDSSFQTLVEKIAILLPKIRPKIFRIGAALGVHAGPGVLLVAIREGER